MISNGSSPADAPAENADPPVLKESSSHSTPNQYAELKRLIKHKGLLDQQPAYFVGKIFLTLILLAVGLTLVLTLENTWLQLLNAAYLAFVEVTVMQIRRT